MEVPERIGRYEVELLLGEGAAGRVWLARDPLLGRPVAIKVLRADPGLTPQQAELLADRIRHEARAVAVLSHPGIVTLHDMGELEGAPYLVFELLAGSSLRERIAGSLAPGEVAQLARTLGAALTYAHDAGVVHRDVKPENVVLALAGPKLTDFGIAHVGPPAIGASIDAAPGARSALAAPAYTAPEALRSGAFSPSSDQFSLAATLYEALTGSRPFGGDDAAAIAERVAAAKHDAPTRVRPDLRGFAHVDAIFDRALSKDVRLRFPSCDAFGSLLAAELEGANFTSSIPAGPRSSIVPRATRRWQNIVAAVAVLVILALVLIGREQRADREGVSLKRVASAFASAAAAHPAPAARPRTPAPSGPSGMPSATPPAPRSAPPPALAVPPKEPDGAPHEPAEHPAASSAPLVRESD